MTVFENVTVEIKANIFENGLCQSRTLTFPDGVKKTLGVYLPGEFVFESHEAEVVLITFGEVQVLFSNMDGWKTIRKGESYRVPPNCTFKVRCFEISEYICDFLV